MPRSLLEGAEFFTALAHTIEGEASHRALVRSAKIVRDEARRVLGTYDYGWPRLQDKTIDRKATGDSPLLETGKLRASIKYEVHDNVAIVGTNDPNGLYNEFGTSRGIPPRPFLLGAAVTMQKAVHETCGKDLFAFAILSKGPLTEKLPDED
jgi:phage gpG-like protein